MGYSYNAPSWMYVDSGVADPWLFEDSGVAEDAVLDIPPATYVYRNITATNNITVKYDCMTGTDCAVALQGDSAAPLVLVICTGCYSNDKSSLIYACDVEGDYEMFTTGPIVSSTEYNTFTVRYDSGHVTVYRNDATTPMYTAKAPYLIQNINIIGIGGCCTRKSVRVARYDPAWRTDTWLTEGRGFSASDSLA
ncbi:hypothetical protein FJT64_001551 [Amphibalanus amphitrite]|uniref:Uncharacterized protein n=1 Tax=Amphibalanus amphitrite TaxID=1232801 RepID=A0A6A4XFL9_AMPAM|nr:hypothetical protein FJT64_001551 [Amphibalanus amphitrite]